VFAAADNVAQRDREVVATERAAEMLVERRAQRVGTGFGGGHRDGDRAVGTDLREVVGAVGGPQCVVDRALVARVDGVDQPWHRVLAGVGDGFLCREFDRLELTG
jgi:hypothetical protein